jgi:hypothetical protein
MTEPVIVDLDDLLCALQVASREVDDGVGTDEEHMSVDRLISTCIEAVAQRIRRGVR